jgi:hypothetical protein
VALRSDDAVREERRQGFTHSHNDHIDVLTTVEGLRATEPPR